jgi:hypothetical protein
MAMMVSTMLSSLALETLPAPAAHRRHPFDLHWRREPPDWAGNLTGAYGRLYAGLMTSRCDVCCVSCGAVPCPYDHDEDKRVRLTDLQFVRELANQRKSLQADLEQVSVNGCDQSRDIVNAEHGCNRPTLKFIGKLGVIFDEKLKAID